MALATAHAWIMSKDNAINTSIGTKTINTTPYQYLIGLFLALSMFVFSLQLREALGNLAENRKLNTKRGNTLQRHSEKQSSRERVSWNQKMQSG